MRLEGTTAGELSTDRAVNKDSQPGKQLPAGGESSGPREGLDIVGTINN